MLVVDYDNLVRNKASVLPPIYDFIRLSYNTAYSDKIHEGSANKSEPLPEKGREVIEQLCVPVYEQVNRMAIQAEAANDRQIT